MLSYEGRKPPLKPPKPKNRAGPGIPVAERLERAKSFQAQVDEGKSQADIARELGVTRTRVTQVMKLLKLSPRIQAYIRAEAKRKAWMTERSLRPLLDMPHARQDEWARRELPGFGESQGGGTGPGRGSDLARSE